MMCAATPATASLVCAPTRCTCHTLNLIGQTVMLSTDADALKMLVTTHYDWPKLILRHAKEEWNVGTRVRTEEL
jgi:hypothetical protein